MSLQRGNIIGAQSYQVSSGSLNSSQRDTIDGETICIENSYPNLTVVTTLNRSYSRRMLYQRAPLAAAAACLFLLYLIYSSSAPPPSQPDNGYKDDEGDYAAAAATLRARGHNNHNKRVATQTRTNRNALIL